MFSSCPSSTGESGAQRGGKGSVASLPENHVLSPRARPGCFGSAEFRWGGDGTYLRTEAPTLAPGPEAALGKVRPRSHCGPASIRYCSPRGSAHVSGSPEARMDGKRLPGALLFVLLGPAVPWASEGQRGRHQAWPECGCACAWGHTCPPESHPGAMWSHPSLVCHCSGWPKVRLEAAPLLSVPTGPKATKRSQGAHHSRTPRHSSRHPRAEAATSLHPSGASRPASNWAPGGLCSPGADQASESSAAGADGQKTSQEGDSRKRSTVPVGKYHNNRVAACPDTYACSISKRNKLRYRRHEQLDWY